MLTEKNKIDIQTFIKTKYGTDSDLLEFCDENSLDYREVNYYICNLNAPESCKKCRYVTNLFTNSLIYPCNECCRYKRWDRYEAVNEY